MQQVVNSVHKVYPTTSRPPVSNDTVTPAAIELVPQGNKSSPNFTLVDPVDNEALSQVNDKKAFPRGDKELFRLLCTKNPKSTV